MVKYRILPEYKLFVLRFWGSTDEQEILAVSDALTSDPEFSYSYDALVDNSDLEHTISGQELRGLVERNSTQSDSPGRLAVVAPSDLVYGVSRMHQLLSEYRTSQCIGVFRDRESALKWLGRENLGLERLCEELIHAD